MAKGKYEEWLLPDNLLRIQGWARDGLTDEQIAKNMGISKQTFYDWQKKFSDFADSVKKNKEVVDREVENALLKSAKGYDVIETVEELRFNKKKGDYEMMVTRRTTKHIPPSQVAQIFWLKNRKPKEWRERQEYEVNLDALNKAADILGGISDVIND